MQLDLGNMISMSPAGGVPFKRGDENSQKHPQTNTFWDIGTQCFFFTFESKKQKYEIIWQNHLYLKKLKKYRYEIWHTNKAC